jgi:predicted nuclease of predicted toxin-antitoxin system
MIGLAFDENFNHDILRGMLRRNAGLDAVRLQDAGLSGQDDPTVLEWAAQQSRVLISYDVSTITAYAYARVAAGKTMPGVFEVPSEPAK